MTASAINIVLIFFFEVVSCFSCCGGILRGWLGWDTIDSKVSSQQ